MSEDWSLESLRQHFESRINETNKRMEDMSAARIALDSEREKAMYVRLAVSQVAIDKSQESTNLRFAAVNEFRAALSDQGSRMMPRVESEAHWQAVAKEVAEVRLQLSTQEVRLMPRAEVDVRWQQVLKDIAVLNTFKDEQMGHSGGVLSGTNMSYRVVVAGGVILAACLSLFDLALRFLH